MIYVYEFTRGNTNIGLIYSVDIKDVGPVDKGKAKAESEI